MSYHIWPYPAFVLKLGMYGMNPALKTQISAIWSHRKHHKEPQRNGCKRLIPKEGLCMVPLDHIWVSAWLKMSWAPARNVPGLPVLALHSHVAAYLQARGFPPSVFPRTTTNSPCRHQVSWVSFPGTRAQLYGRSPQRCRQHYSCSPLMNDSSCSLVALNKDYEWPPYPL